jgi:hypothetical protein
VATTNIEDSEFCVHGDPVAIKEGIGGIALRHAVFDLPIIEKNHTSIVLRGTR